MPLELTDALESSEDGDRVPEWLPRFSKQAKAELEQGENELAAIGEQLAEALVELGGFPTLAQAPDNEQEQQSEDDRERQKKREEARSLWRAQKTEACEQALAEGRDPVREQEETQEALLADLDQRESSHASLRPDSLERRTQFLADLRAKPGSPPVVAASPSPRARPREHRPTRRACARSPGRSDDDPHDAEPAPAGRLDHLAGAAA